MITRQLVKNFREDFDKAVESLAKKYNVKIETKSISYTNDEFHFKVQCTELSPDGEVKVDTTFFNAIKAMLDFKGNLGDSYTDSNGITYTVINLDPNKPKYSVILKGSDGKQYKSTVDGFNMRLKMEEASK